MKKTLGRLTLSTLLLLTVGCTKQPKKVATSTPPAEQPINISANDDNKFRHLSTQEVGDVEVICHNCQAHFKLSHKIQKMSMKGDAIVTCPVCHRNYLGK